MHMPLWCCADSWIVLVYWEPFKDPFVLHLVNLNVRHNASYTRRAVDLDVKGSSEHVSHFSREVLRHSTICQKMHSSKELGLL
jgi:hypothetical protein